ncbi:MAG: fibronectin type III domain-containing protein [Armatimonadota bacterium]|nr:fibronectin type III domain-containing protein [Armatimonadota bacterium]
MNQKQFHLARALSSAVGLLFACCGLAVSAYALTPSGAQISTSSIANYNDSAGTRMPASTSNTVTVTVGQVAGVQLTPATGNVTAQAGSDGCVAVAVKNAGNGSDTFGLAVTGDTSWSPRMVADANGDGVRQSTETTVVTSTPSVAAGASYKCFLVAAIPTAASVPASFALMATSRFDATKKAQGSYTITPGDPPPMAFVREWLLNGYYSNTDRTTRLSTDYLGGETSAAPRAGQSQAGKTWTLKQNSADHLDFLTVYGSTSQYCAVYAFTYVYSPADLNAQVWLGSNDGVKVWLNGANIWTNDVLRGCTPDQDKVSAHLAPGWNRLLLKVAQNTSNWALATRVCDSAGNPIPGVTTSTNPPSGAPTITIVTVTGITTSSATINCTTDELTTATVRYGATTALGSSSSDTTLRTQHSITLTGLSAGTTYHFVVDARDADGNTSSAPSSTFVTTAGSATTAGYIRTWLLNGYYSNISSATRLSQDYLGGEEYAAPRAGQVQGAKTWTFKQSSTDILSFLSVYGSTRTYCAAYACAYVYSPSEQDAQLWLGSNDGVKVWANGVNIWTKDVGRTVTPDQDKMPVHLIAGWNRLIFKVSQNTGGWALVAKVCDSAGKALPGVNVAADTGDTTPPIISDVQVEAVTGSRMVVTWKTSEPTTTRIDYGTTTTNTIVATPQLVEDHAVTLTNLTPNTNYVYKIVAVDVCGNWNYEDGLSQSTTTDQPAPFIFDWLANGFYGHLDRTTRMAADYLGGEATTWPKIGMVSGRYQWSPVTAEPDGYVDLAGPYGAPSEGLGYVNAYIYSPADQTAELRIGSNDGVKVYHNSQMVWLNDVYRSWTRDQDRIPVTLHRDWNCLLIKVTQGTNGWGISARLCDSAGNALPGIRYAVGS